MLKIKRLLAVLVSLTMVLSYMPAPAMADGHGEHDGYTAWSDSTSLPVNAGKYYLTTDVTTSSQQKVAGDVELCLNGHTVISSTNTYGGIYVIHRDCDYTVTITNCSTEGGITSTYAGRKNFALGSFASNSSGGDSKGVFNISNVRFYGVSAGASGGCITVQGQTKLNLTDCTFENITATGGNYDGAAVYAGNTTAVTIKNCTFKNISAGRYAAIYAGGTSTITLDGCSVTGCSGKNAAALYSTANTTVTLKDCSITGNTTTAAAGTDGYRYAGAVYALTNNVTLEGANVIRNNTNAAEEAADFTRQNATNTFKIVNSTDDSDVCVRYVKDPTITEFAAITGTLRGNWIYANDTSKTFVDNGSGKLVLESKISVTGITLNESEKQLTAGEGFDLIATVEPENATKKDVKWTTSNPGVATVSGGTVTAVADGTALITARTVDGDFTATCTVTVGTVTEHKHGEDVYTVWVHNDSLPTASGKYYLDTAGRQVTLSDNWIIGAGADITLCLNGHTINAAPANRAIAIGAGAVLTLVDDADTPGVITGGNRTYGGAINIASGGTLNMYDITISGNRSEDGTGSSGGEGGAVYLQGGNADNPGAVFNMYSGSITGNSATRGGAVSLAAKGEGASTGAVFNMQGGSITANTSAAKNAGAVYGGSLSTINISNAQITDNSTGNEGGAMYLTGGASAALTDSTVSGNTAKNGSAIVVLGGTLTLDGTEVTGNNSTSGFGAVHVSRGTVAGVQQMATLVLKGAAKVTGNTAGKTDTEPGTAQNVMLRRFTSGVQYSYLSVDAAGLSDGASIGVSLEEARYAEEPYISAEGDPVPEGSEAFFSSDADGYNVKIDSGRLILKSSANVMGVTVDPETASIAIGGTKQMTASVVPAGADDQTVIWSSSEPGVASVDDTGLVSGVSEGTAVITVTTNDGGFTAECTVKVFTPHEHDGISFEEWTETTSIPTTDGAYFLTSDVNVSAMQDITGDVTICLNGHSIISNGSSRVIRVQTGGKLTITDCSDTPGSIKGGKSTYGAGVRIQPGGEFNLYNGIIEGNTSDAATGGEGAGVYVLGRNTISGTKYDGGVFNMYGGRITGNNGGVGAAVNVYGFSGSTDIGEEYEPGTFNMYGGEISGNSGTTGTVYIRNYAKANITGGSIHDNTTTKSAAGLYLQANASAALGSVAITGNESGANGAIYVGDNASLTTDGTRITGNSAGALGGGVFVAGSGSTVKLSGATVITGNKADSKDNNLYLSGSAVADPAGLADGASIGVTAASTPASIGTDGSESKLAYFTSDSVYREITVKNGQLYIDTDSSHSHCVCGTGSGIGCDHASLVWSAWESASALPSGSGNYYLTEDVQLTDVQLIGAGEQVNLCLNGHTVKAADNCRIYTIGKGAVLSITDCQGAAGKLTGGNSAYGGAININRTAVFNLYAGTLTGNKARTNSSGAGDEGGAVYMQSGNDSEHGGTFNMYGGEISGNSAGVGGAVRVQGGSSASVAGSINIFGGRISGNTATRGGGIYASDDATVTVSGGSISDNTATNTADAGGGAIYASNVTLDIKGGSISGNTGSGNNGGGVMITGARASLNISGGTFSGNTAKNGGGILAQASSQVSISGGKFTGNKAESDGGAIYISTNSTLKFTGGTVSGNEAGRYGGGACLLRSENTFSGGSFSGNYSGSNGGGAYAMGAKVKLSGTGFSDNRAEGNGGAYAASTTNVTSGGAATSIVSETELTGGTFSGNSAKNGGAILSQGRGSSFKMTGGTVKNNESAVQGGGIFASSNTTFEFSGGTVSGNKAGTNGGGIEIFRAEAKLTGGMIENNSAKVNGGGVHIAGSEAVISGIGIRRNTATGNGGGIVVQTGTDTVNGEKQKFPADVRITGGTFSGNSAKNGGGMLIQGDKSSAVMTGGTFSSNRATDSGGGVYVSTNTSFEMNGGSITGNSSGKDGGGMVTLRSKVNLRGGSISGNTTEASAGGIKNLGASLYLRGVTVSGNEAKVNGGGIRSCNIVQNGVTYIAHLYMSAGSVRDNKAQHGGGLLVEQKGSSFEFSGGTFSGNSASVAGGGFYISTSTVFTMSGGIVENNTTDGSGGGVYILRNDAVITGGEIRNNTAVKSAGGILFTSNLALKNVMNVSGLKITGNKSATAGGVVVQGRATVNMDGVTVSENSCEKNGGGIYFSVNSWLNIKNSVIEKNSALLDGGGIFENIPAILTIENSEIRDNTAGRDGGGFFSRGSNSFKGVVITGNTAAGRGGGAAARKTWYNFQAADWFEKPYQDFIGCTIENNKSGDIGGGLWLDLGTYGTVEDTVIRNNESSTEGSGLWAIDDITLKSVTVTENKSASGGAALYLAPSAYDGFSYFAGIIRMSGDMKVSGNTGKDMYLGDKTVVVVPDEGLGDNALIEIELSDGLITNRIYGPYDYKGGDQKYTLTKGTLSMTDPEYDASAAPVPAEEESSEAQTEPGSEASLDAGSSATPWLIGGIAAGAVALAGAAVAIFKKKSRKYAA